MKRFMGQMPIVEIKKTVTFKENIMGKCITIEAGPNGWTIVYADGGTEYKDNESAGTEANYQEALSTLHTHFDAEDLKEIKSADFTHLEEYTIVAEQKKSKE